VTAAGFAPSTSSTTDASAAASEIWWKPRSAMIAAAADPDAREALLQYARTRRFLPVDAAAAASLRELRDGVARVRAEVE
jgi:hypothetical protein